MKMNLRQMIYTAANCRNTNITAIAEALGTSPSNLHRKIKCNTLKNDDLSKIAEILGGEYFYYFSLPNDIKLGKPPKIGILKRRSTK
jgi:hypothetical protein